MTDNTSAHYEQDPEALLTRCNRSILLKALLISTVVHVGFAGVTSMSLYRDWARHGMFRDGYGLLSPSEMRVIEKDEAKEAERKARDAKMAEELQAQRAEAKLAVASDEAAAPTAAPAAPESTPTAPEIEPLPPKESFSIDDLPGLDL